MTYPTTPVTLCLACSISRHDLCTPGTDPAHRTRVLIRCECDHPIHREPPL